VLGPDVVVPERQRLAQRQLERLLSPGREPRPPASAARERAGPERLLDAAPDLVQVDADRSECAGVEAVGRALDLGAQVLVPGAERLERAPIPLCAAKPSSRCSRPIAAAPSASWCCSTPNRR
jgi:hypothetical protein